MKKDYYEILGLSKSTTQEEIRKSYRKLALKHHPDKHQGDKAAEERFKEISEAYEVLSDENKRATYDRFGHEGLKGAFGSSGFSWQDFTHFEDISDLFGNLGDIFGNFGFDELFGFEGGRRRARGPRKGRDLQYSFEIKFEEAALGAQKSIEISRFDLCDTCKGSGAKPGSKDKVCSSCDGKGQVTASSGFFSISRTCSHCGGSGRVITEYCKKCEGKGKKKVTKKISVKIPAGVDNGVRLRVGNEGDAGERGGPRGDLHVDIYVKEHAIFKRHETDIYCEAKISFPEAVFGAEIDVPTLEGKVKIKIPQGTPSGKIFKLRGKGIPGLFSRSTKGDELVRVSVDVPKKLTEEQKNILKEYAKTLGKITGEKKGIFDKVKKAFK